MGPSAAMSEVEVIARSTPTNYLEQLACQLSWIWATLSTILVTEKLAGILCPNFLLTVW